MKILSVLLMLFLVSCTPAEQAAIETALKAPEKNTGGVYGVYKVKDVRFDFIVGRFYHYIMTIDCSGMQCDIDGVIVAKTFGYADTKKRTFKTIMNLQGSSYFVDVGDGCHRELEITFFPDIQEIDITGRSTQHQYGYDEFVGEMEDDFHVQMAQSIQEGCVSP